MTKLMIERSVSRRSGETTNDKTSKGSETTTLGDLKLQNGKIEHGDKK